MSAIWGNIDFNGKNAIDSMASEYRRKCRLDKIVEKKLAEGIFGCGLQFINDEDEYEEMPYILDENEDIITESTNKAEGRTIILSDCILDNREELIGEFINTESENENIPDGKLICLAYKKWGYDLVRHLVGIYSVAIYDAVQKKLFLFVDRTSSRCLYYYKRGASVTFSTLISPIKKLYPDIQKNEMYLKDFLLIPGLLPNISSTETPYENIFIIEAGSSITITEKEVISDSYWSPEVVFNSRDMSFLKDRFLSTYKNAVKRAVRTNKKVAIALSGGFDSASVAALAAPELAKQGKELISYTYVPYYDMSKFFDRRIITNESGYVREIAKMYPNIETNFTNNDGKSFWGYVDELVDVMEIPFKAFVNLPQLLEIYRAAGDRGCKIFLNGQTGNASVSFGEIDESVYCLVRNMRFFSAIRYFNNFCKNAGLGRKQAFIKEIKKILAQLENSPVLEQFGEDDINSFVNKDLLAGYDFNERNRCGNLSIDKQTILKWEDYKYEVYTLPALSYIGAMETKLGLYTGVVIRDATRDMDILSYCLSYPYEFYSYEGTPRYLIRGFMDDLLPSCILYPIIKTGRQSTDWIYRLAKSKKDILSKLKKECSNDSLQKYINVSKIFEYLDAEHDFNLDNEQSYLYLFIVHVFLCFVEKYDSCP